MVDKKKLFQSLEDTKIIEVEAIKEKVNDDELAKLKIRPLSDVEYSEIEDLTLQGINMTNKIDREQIQKLKSAKTDGEKRSILDELDINIDITKLKTKDQQSNYLICKYGLSAGEEEWTEEDVGKLPPGAPKEIADKIMKFSGLDSESMEELEPFREE